MRCLAADANAARWCLVASELTVDALHGSDDVLQGHLLDTGGLEVGQDTWAGGELLGEVLLCPAIVFELELLWDPWLEIGLEEAERVELCLVVASDLVRSDEELDLWQSSKTAGEVFGRKEKGSVR